MKYHLFKKFVSMTSVHAFVRFSWRIFPSINLGGGVVNVGNLGMSWVSFLGEFFGKSCHKWCYPQDLWRHILKTVDRKKHICFFLSCNFNFKRLTRFSWSGTDSKWYYATCCLEGDCTISFLGSNHHSPWLMIYLFISYSSAQPNDKAFFVFTPDKERMYNHIILNQFQHKSNKSAIPDRVNIRTLLHALSFRYDVCCLFFWCLYALLFLVGNFWNEQLSLWGVFLFSWTLKWGWRSNETPIKNSTKWSSRKKDTLPETNIAPKNGWLEYYFPIWGGQFSEAMFVSGRVDSKIFRKSLNLYL